MIWKPRWTSSIVLRAASRGDRPSLRLRSTFSTTTIASSACAEERLISADRLLKLPTASIWAALRHGLTSRPPERQRHSSDIAHGLDQEPYGPCIPVDPVDRRAPVFGRDV